MRSSNRQPANGADLFGVNVQALTTMRAYAAHRGVNASSVLRAIRSGRLSRSIVRDVKGLPRIADVDLADQEWAANTDLSRAPGYVKARADGREFDPGAPDDTAMSLSAASALLQAWKGKLAELEYRRRTADLVDAREIEEKIVEMITRCRAKLLGLPSRMKARVPRLTTADLLKIDSLILVTLEELANWRPAPQVKGTEAHG